jgi:hypothetical protein
VLGLLTENNLAPVIFEFVGKNHSERYTKNLKWDYAMCNAITSEQTIRASLDKNGLSMRRFEKYTGSKITLPAPFQF